MEIEKKKTRIAKAPVSVKTEATAGVKFFFLQKMGGRAVPELILASTP